MEQEKNFIGYEYLDIVLKPAVTAIYIDGYQNFGWELLDKRSEKIRQKEVLQFKRNRKIRNKAELTRLQRQFDSIVVDIQHVEKSKKTVPNLIAVSIFILGCAFMALSVFAVTDGSILKSILFAVPGFAAWLGVYFAHQKVKAFKRQQLQPKVEADFDLIYEICQKGSRLL